MHLINDMIQQYGTQLPPREMAGLVIPVPNAAELFLNNKMTDMTVSTGRKLEQLKGLKKALMMGNY